MPIDWTAVGVGLGLLAAWLIVREVRKPKYLVTVQRVTNQNTGETVTVQANQRRGSIKALFDAIDRMGSAAHARGYFINEEILDETRKSQDAMRVRVLASQAERDKVVTERRRRKLARRLGIPVDQVTDEQVLALRNGRPAPVAEVDA